MLSDKIVGWMFIGLSTSCVAFYTIWVVFLKFVDEEQLIHQYFPDQFYALAFPLLAGVLGLVLIGGFVLYVLQTSDNSDSSVTNDVSSAASKKHR